MESFLVSLGVDLVFVGARAKLQTAVRAYLLNLGQYLDLCLLGSLIVEDLLGLGQLVNRRKLLVF